MNRRSARKMTFPSLESLENRVALSATPGSGNADEMLVDLKGGPLLGLIYTEFVNYEQAGGHGTFLTAQSNLVETAGEAVGVNIQFNGGSFATEEAQMQQLGMLVTATAPSLGIVEGFMPIASLPSVAGNASLGSLTPVLKPPSTSGPTPGAAAITTPVTTPAPAPSAPIPTTPSMIASFEGAVNLKGGPELGAIYTEFVNYEQAGGTGTFSSPQSSQVVMAGEAVGINIRTSAANFTNMLDEMEEIGMDVTATASSIGVIEGFLPIAQLPAVAANTGLVGMDPVLKPTFK
jgi:hypothetical protein